MREQQKAIIEGGDEEGVIEGDKVRFSIIQPYIGLLCLIHLPHHYLITNVSFPTSQTATEYEAHHRGTELLPSNVDVPAPVSVWSRAGVLSGADKGS